MAPPRPRKELDSKRLQNSLRANILTMVSNSYRVRCFIFSFVQHLEKQTVKFMKYALDLHKMQKLQKNQKSCKAVSCRAVWRVCREDIELAMYQIASKRLSLDDVLSNISGIQFFISCVTCVTTNAKSSEDCRGETYPAIAYFIVYRENDECNETTIFAKLHNEEVEPGITPIRVRVSSCQNRQTETAAKQLFQVIKDHNSEAVQELLDFSNACCYQEAADSFDDPDSDDKDIFRAISQLFHVQLLS